MLFWSTLGAQSSWVRAEYEYAKLAGKPVCLIRFPGVGPPNDWHPDVEWVDLEGVTFSNPGGPFPIPMLSTSHGVRVTRQFRNTVRKIVAFARDAVATPLRR